MALAWTSWQSISQGSASNPLQAIFQEFYFMFVLYSLFYPKKTYEAEQRNRLVSHN